MSWIMDQVQPPCPTGRLSRPEILGRIAVLGAAACWAAGGIFTRLYYDAGGVPSTLVAARTAIAGAGFVAWYLIASSNHMGRRDVLVAVGIGCVQASFTTALVVGIDHAPVALVVLLFYTYPLLVAVGAAAFFGERLSRTGVIFVAVGTAGLVLAIGTPATVTTLGVVLGLAAGIGNTIVVLGNRVLLGRGLRVIDLATVSYALPAAAAIILVVANVIPLPPGSAESWAYGIAYATTGTVLPWLLFYSAVPVIGASLAALLATAEPLISVVLAYAILGETLTTWQLVGGSLIIVSIVGLAARRSAVPETPHSHL
jgi:drug/metabolite transporter (DMT)-like permease